MRKHIGFCAGILLASALAVTLAVAGGTKYAGTYGGAAATSAAVTFDPNKSGVTKIKAICGTTDLEGGLVKIYARGGAAKVMVTGGSAASATNLNINNTGLAFTTNDTIVLVHASGAAPEYRTVTTSTSTGTIYVTSGWTAAVTNGDYVYEVTQQGQILVGLSGTGPLTNDVLNLTGDIFTSPGDSPLYVVLSGTSNTTLQVTVE